jgi:hypothetical protein
MHETITELHDEFDTTTIEELYEAVAEFFEDEHGIDRNDALEFLMNYGVEDAYHGVMHEGVYQGSYHSIDDFWDSYLDDMYGDEYEELLQTCLRMDLRAPEVDTIAVEQNFDRYFNGSVFVNNW